MPRFRITGTSTRPTSFSRSKFCMLRVPIWITSTSCAQERVEHPHVHQLGDDRQAVARGGVLEQLQAVDALALERVGAGARLERAAAHQARAARRDRRGGRAHLRLGLDRARSGDHLHGVAADRNAAHAHDGARLVPLARDELVRLDDVHRALDAGQRVEHLRRRACARRRSRRSACARCRAKRARPSPAARILASTAAISASPASGCITTIMVVSSFGCVGIERKKIRATFWGRPNRGILLLLLEVYGRAGPSGEYPEIEETRTRTAAQRMGKARRGVTDEFMGSV